MKLKKRGKRLLSVLMAFMMVFSLAAILPGTTVSAAGALPKNVVIGYWENWSSKSARPDVTLRNVDSRWDVINVSFMICDSTNYTASFTVDSSLYKQSTTALREQAFKDDVKFCQDRGQKVLISAGGATGLLAITSTQQRDIYLNSVIAIIDKYGFDGIDIDFEGSGSILSVTSTDSLNSCTTQIQNYLVYILHQLKSRYGSDFMITMAPEHPYVQGAVQAWGGWHNIYGGYLPLIHQTRDILTFIHPQYYNNAISGYTGFSGYNVNSLVKLSEMLIDGFTTKKGEAFPGLRPDQVAIGIPLSGSASQGKLSIADYQSALGQLIQKYPTFRGIMTWSINYDVSTNSFVQGMKTTIAQYAVPDPVYKDVVFKTLSSKVSVNKAASTITSSATGLPIVTDLVPRAGGGKTMIPLRCLATVFGATAINWVPGMGTSGGAEIIIDGYTLSMPAGLMYFDKKNNSTGQTTRINIEAGYPPVQFVTANDIYIPLRSVTEAMGYKVSWQGEFYDSDSGLILGYACITDNADADDAYFLKMHSDVKDSL